MLRILLPSLIFVVSLFLGDTVSAACGSATDTPANFIESCAGDSVGLAVIPDGELGTSGVRSLIIDIAEKVIQFGALFAIGAIVFSGIRYTTSAGDDEKIKSAKNTAVFAVV
jgi:hypothetical protein